MNSIDISIMDTFKKIDFNFDIDEMPLGSFAMGINKISNLEAKVQGLLF